MVFKKILIAFFVLLTFQISSPGFCAYENMEPMDPMEPREESSKDLSSMTEAELIAMERELKAKLGMETSNADLYYELSAIYATLFDRTRTQKGTQYREWLMKSRDALEKVLMIRPQDKIAHYNLGVVYKRLGQMERAREELKKAIRLCGTEEDRLLLCALWMQVGSVYEEQGFFDEAKEAYLKARELDYGNPDIQEAIREIDVKRKTPEKGSSASLGMPGMMGAADPKTAAALGRDPYSQDQGGMEQAIPALGQALMQTFGGGGGGGEDQSGSSL